MTDTKATCEDAQAFTQEEDGAVTVDWVVLAAAVVVLAIPIATTLNSSVGTAASDIASRVENATND
ncbi:MAG: pilus assembly protein [Rhodobacteraceae bacterium]|nr:pilus assembly protein [Paracoccaceae bacterium]